MDSHGHITPPQTTNMLSRRTPPTSQHNSHWIISIQIPESVLFHRNVHQLRLFILIQTQYNYYIQNNFLNIIKYAISKQLSHK